MSAIDAYLKNIEPSKRKELIRIRKLAKEAVPSAEETISYGIPTLKYRSKPFLGFDAHSRHIGLYPFGAAPIRELKAELQRYSLSKGAIRVPLDQPIPKRLLTKLITCKIRMIEATTK
jgi:uncharacterized protein YdhG (YjbR/CyaY superfamily)